MANDQMSYKQWLSKFKKEAQMKGIHAKTLQILDQCVSDPAIIRLDQKQPETQETFESYLKRLGPKVPSAVVELKRHKKSLQAVEKTFQVPTSVVLALWGMESHFGAITGHFFTLNALVTLAYEGRRAQFFRQELIEALKMVQDHHVPVEKLKGSWAGALGQTQFMPSTYNKHAVDFSQKGFKDVWSNHEDVFASISNYLRAIGWSKMPWGGEVTLPPDFDAQNISPTVDKKWIKKSLTAWHHLGVHSTPKIEADQFAENWVLVRPDQNGRAFLVSDNFFVIFQWNRSIKFALTVLLLADEIRSKGMSLDHVKK